MAHHPCLLGVTMIWRDQYGYAFSGSPWWGEINIATSPLPSRGPHGGILALRVHCALLLDYVPPEEPLGTPLGNTPRIRRPKVDWRGP